MFNMNSDLQFGWATVDDFDEIRAFVVAGFGENSFQAHPERILWLYFSNPHGVHISTCRHAGQLVAVCPHVIQGVSLAGQKMDAAFGIDFYVDPAWRRQGIANQFLTMRRDRFELSLSTGQSPSMHALYLKIGAKDLGPIRIAYGRKKPPTPAPTRQFVRGVLTWLKCVFAKGSPIDLVESPALDSKQRSSLSRWQQWRFGEATPYLDHHYLVSADGGSLAMARQSGDVLQLLGLGPGQNDRAKMLGSVVQSSAAAEVQLLFCGRALAEDCIRAGFLLGNRDARLVAMTDDPNIEKLLIPGCVDLMAETSDTDLMRQPPVSGKSKKPAPR